LARLDTASEEIAQLGAAIGREPTSYWMPAPVHGEALEDAEPAQQGGADLCPELHRGSLYLQMRLQDAAGEPPVDASTSMAVSLEDRGAMLNRRDLNPNFSPITMGKRGSMAPLLMA
jgi:hypothetical protein